MAGKHSCSFCKIDFDWPHTAKSHELSCEKAEREFPFRFNCVFCDRAIGIRVAKTGNQKCPSCEAKYLIEKSGKVKYVEGDDLIRSTISKHSLKYEDSLNVRFFNGTKGIIINLLEINEVKIERLWRHIVVHKNTPNDKVDRIFMIIRTDNRSHEMKFGVEQYDDVLIVEKILSQGAQEIAKEKELNKEYADAIKIYERIGEWKDANRLKELIAKDFENSKNYREAIKIYEEVGDSLEVHRLKELIAKDFESLKRYKDAISLYREIGEERYTIAIDKLRQKAHELMKTDKQIAMRIYNAIGEDADKVNSRKIAASLREDALDYEAAIEIWEELGLIKEAARVRKLKAEQGSVKVDQTVIHGDYVDDRDTTYVDDRDTIIQDSVVNKSNIGTGGKSKAEELREVKALLDDGIINEDDYEKMKREIIG